MLTSEWLEALARKPFALHREILRELAEHFRRIEAMEAEADHAGQAELALEVAA